MHTIRLRGPWKFESITDPTDLAGERQGGPNRKGRVKMPATWGDLDPPDSEDQAHAPVRNGARDGVRNRTRAAVRLLRVFHRPTFLAELERVLLRVEPAAGSSAEVMLNDQPLGPADAAKPVDVTDRLQKTNRLEVVLPSGPDAHQPLLGEVRLEILER